VQARLKGLATLANATFVLALVLFAWLVWYFYTGRGGPSELACYLVPLALALQILFTRQNGPLYPWLPAWANHALVAFYLGICAYAFAYFWVEYEQIAIYRQGSYTTQDFVVGLLAFLLVMELSRLLHPILFWVNVVLVAYTLYGYLSPLDFFWHPGTSFYRVVTSSSVELATGIYGLYAQLALTLIAAFLLLAAAAEGFGAQKAMVNVMRRIAGRSRHTIPQTAVLASVSVGLVSGSGSANAAVVGSFTIPLMMRYGISGTFAAAVETSASMGGLIMPPMMAVAGFLMAEFLGVPYWDVVMRGFAVSFVYFTALALAIYLMSVRLLSAAPIVAPPVALYEVIKTAIFFLAVAFLIVLMGWIGVGALRAALYTAMFMFACLLAAFVLFKYLRRDPAVAGESIFANIRSAILTHAEMTSYLTLLLATLGIMIGLFTVTGFINRMGGMLLELGQWHIAALILMAWVFGWLVGAGLPPTATYIILAVITVDPMRKLGIDPWVAHFFAFLMAVWGELSPPTSLTAAVASRIAKAPFMSTMWEALKLCIPLTFMTFAVFTRSDMVTKTGWAQVADTMLVAAASWGLACAIFGRLAPGRGASFMLRASLALLSFWVMFHPDARAAWVGAAALLPATAYAVIRHKRIAPPKDEARPHPPMEEAASAVAPR
jgi:TRAP transporter 4TM/12TM fusion protein